jgi:hypothetical protein
MSGPNVIPLRPEGTGVGRLMIEKSISAYYHTGMREVFVGILSALAIFLVCC